MKIKPLLLALAFLSSTVMADNLPDLGDGSQGDLTPAQERKLGLSVMRDIRWHEPMYINDAEVAAYLNQIGHRLTGAVPGIHQDFEFFALRDPTLNAFALPGGFVGVHSGLIIATQSESELAGVLGHEVSHVTQHHIARLMGKQSQGNILALAGLLVAILARNNAQMAQAALAGGQAAGIQTQLNYSRDFEREADRLGLVALEASGFDVRGMASFFERLQRETRIVENNAPSYLRTHPLTVERIADMENRVQSMPYKQVRDSLEYQLVRAKLKASQGSPADAVLEFQTQLKQGKFSSEAAARYGLTRALLLAKNLPQARLEMLALRHLKPASAMIDTLDAEIHLAAGDKPGALAIYREARSRYAGNRALFYGLVETMLASGDGAGALKEIETQTVGLSSDPVVLELQAKIYAQLGRRLALHRAQAELYVQQGRLTEAVLQLQLAQRAGDGDFYEHSAVDSRLRQVQALDAEERHNKQKQ